MKDVAVVSYCRTAIARAVRGALEYAQEIVPGMSTAAFLERV